MKPFRFARASSVDDVLAQLAAEPSARCIAGGTNLVDYMKERIEDPDVVIDINALPFGAIVTHRDRIEVGALVRMNDAADDREVGAAFPAVVQALRESASPQLRNMATIGGNLMQRTRCVYFRDVATPCNKRTPGAGCSAIGGWNRMHAVLGTSDACIAVHPSDLAVALVAVDATVHVRGRDGERVVPIAQFHRLPADTPNVETALRHDELIARVSLPRSRLASASTYLKVRDRATFEFALVSVAAALDVADGVVRDARVALGGVAPVPWRALEAERELIGNPPTEAAFRRSAQAALRDARGYGHNDFKIPLAERAIVRALTTIEVPR